MKFRYGRCIIYHMTVSVITRAPHLLIVHGQTWKAHAWGGGGGGENTIARGPKKSINSQALYWHEPVGCFLLIEEGQ